MNRPLRAADDTSKNMTATQLTPTVPANESQDARPLTNPNLSASLRNEFGALVEDVHRVHELCAEFERQLAGKSTELDEVKELFAKTQKDLVQLQNSVGELRVERHRLANEAMRAVALARKVSEITAERDTLLAEVAAAKGHSAPSRARVATAENSGAALEVEVVLSEMWRAVERLQTILDPDEVAAATSARITRGSAPEDNSPSERASA